MKNRVIWLMVFLLIGFLGAGPGQAQDVVNLLPNGGFESGAIGPYGTYGTVTSTVVTDCAGADVPEGPIEGNYCLHVVVPEAGDNDYSMGMSDGSRVWEQGKKYTFACFMKTKSGTLQVRLKPERATDPYEGYNPLVVTVTDTWTEFWTTTDVFTTTVSPASATFHFGFSAGDFWIDGIRVYEGDYVPPAFIKNFAARDPSPEAGAVDVPREVVTSWKAGPFAETHNVYFGDSFDDVNNASVADPMGVLAGTGQTAATFDPEGLLDFDTTYYWRVDEVNAPSAPATYKGVVWSFTTEPYAYALPGVTATASSSAVGMGPEKTVDGSGLSAAGLHSSTDTDMWLSAAGQTLPAWIQYDLGGVRKLLDMTVWNSNQRVEAFVGFGAKDVTIEYSLDGETWTTMDTVEIPRAPGADTYAGSVIDMSGVEARFVRLVIESSWGGFLPQAGLSEVRFTYVPVTARAPQPTLAADGVSVNPVLTWRPGREAVSHEVYLSADRQAVVDGTALVGTTTDQYSYQAAGLEYGQTYYWKVNEVNDASVREGTVWSFSTTESFVVDDFESYNDDDHRIYESWVDGYTNQSNGSTVGYFQAPFAERTIVHGGDQSMPFAYDNTKAPYYSEAEREFGTAQDWTVQDVDSLMLWVRGYPSIGEVAVSESGGKMSLTGAGTDIWGNSDEFTYAYKTLTGDGTMTARVTGIGPGSNTWAKGGVMIRDTLNGGSTHAMMVLTANTDGTAGNGASFQYRATTDGVSASMDSTSVIAPPYWVKIERMGDTLTGYVSASGATWTTVGTMIIEMEDPVQIGLCVTSHAPGEDRTFQFDNISATGGVSGQWQGVVINAPVHNSNEPLYVIVEDSSGKKATATDAAAVTTDGWTEVRFPLADFAGVNMAKVKKLTIGVGDRTNPQAGGVGRIFIDDILVGRRGSSDPGTSGLQAYYALESDVLDGSGNGHDGTAVGDPVFVEGPVGMGQALQFDGAGGQYVDLGTWNPSAATGQLCVSLWAKWAGLTDFYQGLIAKRDTWAANDMMWQIEANQTTGNLTFSRTDVYPASGNPVLPIGEWTHVLVSFDGTTAKFYVNGKMTGEGVFSFGTDPAAGLHFGCCDANGGNPFNGALDEVRIYDRPLSTFEINYLAGIR